MLKSNTNLELVADIQHEIWSHWMRYQFSQCTKDGSGQMIIPAALVERWQRQMETSYEQLSEQEKDSDREQAQKILNSLNI